MSRTAPPRPDAAPWLRRGRAGPRWIPAIGVAVVAAVTTLGGFVAAGVLSEPAGPPVSIPGVVAIQPLSGWQPAAPGAIDQRPFVRVTRGSGTLAAFAWGPFPGSAEGLAVEVREDLLRAFLGQLSVSEGLTDVPFDEGPVGRRFTFVGVDRESGAAVEGEVTTVVTAAGQGVVFVGIAPEGLLAFIAGDLRTMVTRADFGAAP